jgi:hypothetical protein
MWCIPPEQNADFVSKMEDVLDVYALPYDENCPVLCLDEKPYQLLGERREPLPMTAGNPAKTDNEYERNGTCSIFTMCEPLTGWHHAHARERRTAVDFAHEIDWIFSQSPYKNVPKIKLLMDNLNTHVISSLYKTFEPKKARDLAKKLEIHYTPKHGSWLNIAEIAISILSKQCIDRRIPTLKILNQEISTWKTYYNENRRSVLSQFTTDCARIKLKRLYPVF